MVPILLLQPYIIHCGDKFSWASSSQKRELYNICNSKADLFIQKVSSASHILL